MIKPSARLVKVEIAVAVFAGVLGVVTAFWHDWIEALTGWDPDHHSGSIEWLIVVALLAVAIAVGLLARRHMRELKQPLIQPQSSSH
jgi:undecaprenyl pyrophosphate phosphatase UppP